MCVWEVEEQMAETRPFPKSAAAEAAGGDWASLADGYLFPTPPYMMRRGRRRLGKKEEGREGEESWRPRIAHEAVGFCPEGEN